MIDYRIETILPRLKKCRRLSAVSWLALCPAHDDHKPSLGIRIYPDGGISLKCFSHDCNVFEILSALGLPKNFLCKIKFKNKSERAQISQIIQLFDKITLLCDLHAVLNACEFFWAVSNRLLHKMPIDYAECDARFDDLFNKLLNAEKRLKPLEAYPPNPAMPPILQRWVAGLACEQIQLLLNTQSFVEQCYDKQREGGCLSEFDCIELHIISDQVAELFQYFSRIVTEAIYA